MANLMATLWGTKLTRPTSDGFAALPPAVERVLTGAPGGLALGDVPERCDRVAVVLLDAFGMRFVERHADHPLLRQLRISPLRSQFPSTTTAHVTTMHTGTPVGAHGLYEWNVYEPALDAVITPILYAAAGSYEPDGLRGSGVAMADIVPPGTIYERLAEAGVPSVVLQPSAFSPSTYDSVALRGAELRPYDTIEDGAAGLAAALERPGYAYLYWHEIDMTGHLRGPDSPEFDAACVRALDALEAARDRIFVGPALGLTYNLTQAVGQWGVTSERARAFERELEISVEAVARMRKRGIRILPGGDYGFVFTPHGTYARDLWIFVKILGFSPMETLVAATKLGGELMGRPGELGVVKAGALADLLLVDGDPLAHVEILQDRTALRMIMKDGALHKAPVRAGA